MAEFQLVMPKMGESVIEATLLTWHKKPGDTVHENEIILEVATDKVDSEVPCPVSGTVKKLLFNEGDVAAVGAALAIIETDGSIPVVVEESNEPIIETPPKEEVAPVESTLPEKPIVEEQHKIVPEPQVIEDVKAFVTPIQSVSPPPAPVSGGRYYSPLVLNIAQVEGIGMAELETVPGTGADGRVSKEDILAYVEKKKRGELPKLAATTSTTSAITKVPETISSKSSVEIIEMDRMRKLIAKNMVDSRRISAHVSSFVEVDVTTIVKWREKVKESFKKKEGLNITYMPIFVEAIAKAIRDFPMINISVDGDKILKKKDINIGIATALPSGNLIVPVIKNADRMNLTGLAAAINNLANKARNNQLKPDDIEGGTYTISNIGSFGNIIGTPIIPQPQVAIMAVGAITKKPVVLETPQGDVIAIRHMMYLSHTYDHRVVDGQLGGMFVKRVAEYLEAFDADTVL
jgi:2-oxoglutarate dehydrogenase E2 component (dihydrolipoamide succinyltransferase)